MYWRLSKAVTTCIASDRVIFLDLGQDRYYALHDGHSEEFRRWLLEPGGDRSAPCQQLMTKLGIAGADDGSVVPEPCSPGTTVPLDPEWFPATAISATRLVQAGAVVLIARRDVRPGQLGPALRRRFGGAPQGSFAGRQEVDARVAEFRTLRPFIPVPRVCLHDSLALVEWLRPAGAAPELVFGVSAYPFAAHCWVQWQGLRLDDHPDHPSRFQPILHLS